MQTIDYYWIKKISWNHNYNYRIGILKAVQPCVNYLLEIHNWYQKNSKNYIKNVNINA